MKPIVHPNPRPRRGLILKGWLMMLALAAGIVFLILLLRLSSQPASQTSRENLVVYCAAGIKPPVEASAREFENAHHLAIQLQYGGSGTLLSNLQLAGVGDLFLAADASYIRLAQKKNLVTQAVALATMQPVIAVHQGNPKHIHSLADLRRPDVTLAFANPDAASIGRTVRKLLEDHHQWDDFQPHVTVFKPTVNDVANDVKIGTVDAAIVWDATARQYPALQMVHDPLLDTVTETVTIGVLKFSKHPDMALSFAQYLAAADQGQPHFRADGYSPPAP